MSQPPARFPIGPLLRRLSPHTAPLRVRAAGLLVALAIGGAACVHTYEAPQANEPHAIVKFRRSYETMSGSSLREILAIDDHVTYSATVGTQELHGARHDGQLVHPRPATFGVRAEFFHVEMRMVMDTVWVPEPYTVTESHPCGGRMGCMSMVTVMRTHLVPRQRLVSKLVEVPDAVCSSAVRFFPEVNGNYLLQYTFQEHGMCSLSCYSQWQKPDGGFELRPCRPAPPAEG